MKFSKSMILIVILSTIFNLVWGIIYDFSKYMSCVGWTGLLIFAIYNLYLLYKEDEED